MFDYVRFPTDGVVAGGLPRDRSGEPKWQVIAEFVEYATAAPQAARRPRLRGSLRALGHA